MGCYYTLYHNTYAFSLLFYKVYMKRENVGSWDSGLAKEQILETYSAQLQKSWNPMKVIFGFNKKYWWRNQRQGAHTLVTRVECTPLPCGPPDRPPMPIFCYMVCFDQEKSRGSFSGQSTAISRRNLGRSNLGLRRSYSSGETSFQEGEIEAIIIPTILSSRDGQSSSTASRAASPLKP